MAAAVPGGRTTPGKRKTTTCPNGLEGPLGLVGGMAYKKEVGLGASVGEIMAGWPAGTRPKRGRDIFGYCLIFEVCWVDSEWF